MQKTAKFIYLQVWQILIVVIIITDLNCN